MSCALRCVTADFPRPHKNNSKRETRVPTLMEVPKKLFNRQAYFTNLFLNTPVGNKLSVLGF
jgi:hypothetical protein